MIKPIAERKCPICQTINSININTASGTLRCTYCDYCEILKLEHSSESIQSGASFNTNAFSGLWADTLLRIIHPNTTPKIMSIEDQNHEPYISIFADHKTDINEGIQERYAAVLNNLLPNGTLIIQIPLPYDESSEPNNEQATINMFEEAFGYHLIGRKIISEEVCPYFIGIVVRETSRVPALRKLAERVLDANGTPVTQDEKLVRFQLHVLITGTDRKEDLRLIAELEALDCSDVALNRLSDLWIRKSKKVDLLQKFAARLRSQLAITKQELRSARLDFAALANDAALNTIELTNEIGRLKSPRLPENGPDTIIFPSSTTRNNSSSQDSHPASITDTSIFNIDFSQNSDLLPNTGHRFPVSDNVANPWPKERPLVSIIITSFNYGHFVDDAIKSALSQTFKSVEVIVVEGGSSDLKSRLHVAAEDRSRVRVLMQGAANRAGANRNFGTSQALGKYICCLDADDKIQPTYIEKAIFFLEQCGFDIVSSGMTCFGNESFSYHVRERLNLEDLMAANHILTCAVFRKESWRKAGGFRDSNTSTVGHVHEDWSFWVRLAALGAKIYNMGGDELLLYRVHGKSLSRGENVLRLNQQQALIAQINADVITDEAKDFSRWNNGSLPMATEALTPESYNSGPKKYPSTRSYSILIAMPYLVLGGAERLLSSIVKYLVDRGWHIVIITSLNPAQDLGDTTSWFEDYTSHIYKLPKFIPTEYWAKFLEFLIKGHDVDLIWVIGSSFVYDNLRSIRRNFPDIRVVDLLFNTVGHTENNRRRRSEIDLILVESNAVKRWLLARGESDHRVQVIESGVDTALLSPSLRSEQLRSNINQGSNDLIVAFCGRWSSEKAPLAYIEIARRANPEWPLRFVMTGAGQMEPEIKNAIAAAGFEPGRFQLFGEVEDVWSMVASADLLIIPSVLDGRPIVALEALSCGTPILASSVGGLPALIELGQTGWLCPPGDITAFVDRLSEVVRQPDILTSMRSNARLYAERHLNLNHMCNIYENALIRLVDSKSQNR